MNFSTYKIQNKLPHLNEALANFIISYCLTVMPPNEKKFDNWHVGISINELDNIKFQSGQCASHLEALQTKIYLVNERGMLDDNSTLNGDEYLFMYIANLIIKFKSTGFSKFNMMFSCYQIKIKHF